MAYTEPVSMVKLIINTNNAERFSRLKAMVWFQKVTGNISLKVWSLKRTFTAGIPLSKVSAITSSSWKKDFCLLGIKKINKAIKVKTAMLITVLLMAYKGKANFYFLPPIENGLLKKKSK